MPTYQTLGIVLKKINHNEADQLFSIYTSQVGKITALGRGTKKIQSKLNSSLQYFAVLNLMIASGKNYDHIAGVEIIKNFSNIKSDLKKIILATFSLELIDKLIKVGVADDKIFILLLKYLQAINNNSFSDKEWEVIRQVFIIKLLTLLGFAPPEKIIFDPKKLDSFLKQHLNSELQTAIFLAKMRVNFSLINKS